MPVGTAQAASTGGAPAATGRAKNLIFLVVDGMSAGTLALAHHWKLRHQKELLHWMRLLERDDLQRGLMDTASASSPVTDSAAAASAWGCGQRVMNGSICMDAAGKALKPLMSYAKQAGKRTGLVSTCRVSHATPAGFTANVANRGQENQIVRQYLERGVDVLLGGGAKHFKQRDEGGMVDYVARFREQGYQVVRDRAALAAAKTSDRLLGLFADDHIPYAIDRANDPARKGVPGLSEMFKAALARLGGSKDGFVLQVEGGRVDHAGHANDPGAILHEMLEFDQCIPVALDFIKQHPDTLLVITTDHGTGGCQLVGHGANYNDSGPALDRIDRLRHSFEWLQEKFTPAGRGEPHLIEQALAIAPTAEQMEIINRGMNRKGEYLSGSLLQAFGQQLLKTSAVGWSSQTHTAECVDLFAFGPGSETVPPFLNNNDLFGIVTKALGLS